jgi:choline transport protein
MADFASRASSDEKKHADEKDLEDRPLTPNLVKDLAEGNSSMVNPEGNEVNPSGHRDQLQRHYGTLEICGLALNIDNAWVAFGAYAVES